MDNSIDVDKFGELVREMLLQGGERITYLQLAEELALPEYGITFTKQAISMWMNGKQTPGIHNLRLLAMHGATERAREFGRRGLAIYGLRVIE
jgi:hypothetical protein